MVEFMRETYDVRVFREGAPLAWFLELRDRGHVVVQTQIIASDRKMFQEALERALREIGKKFVRLEPDLEPDVERLCLGHVCLSVVAESVRTQKRGSGAG